VIFEHRTYLPGFGFFLAMTCAFFYFFREQYLKIALIILLMVAAVNTALTYQRNKIWKNEYTLWDDCLKKSPDKARVNNNFGTTLSDKGKFVQAIYYYNKAILLAPDYLPYYNRGKAYSKLGQYQRAIEDYNEAIRLKPDYANAYDNRGFAYVMQGKNKLACSDAKKACELGNCKTLESDAGKALCH
jgi:tetratricopeptide (TPR) repeat protein